MKKCFVFSGCGIRFAHANRHCPNHVAAALKRDDINAVCLPDHNKEDISPEIMQWFKKYAKQILFINMMTDTPWGGGGGDDS